MYTHISTFSCGADVLLSRAPSYVAQSRLDSVVLHAAVGTTVGLIKMAIAA